MVVQLVKAQNGIIMLLFVVPMIVEIGEVMIRRVGGQKIECVVFLEYIRNVAAVKAWFEIGLLLAKWILGRLDDCHGRL